MFTLFALIFTPFALTVTPGAHMIGLAALVFGEVALILRAAATLILAHAMADRESDRKRACGGKPRRGEAEWVPGPQYCDLPGACRMKHALPVLTLGASTRDLPGACRYA
jgi:hypothetical protein